MKISVARLALNAFIGIALRVGHCYTVRTSTNVGLALFPLFIKVLVASFTFVLPVFIAPAVTDSATQCVKTASKVLKTPKIDKIGTNDQQKDSDQCANVFRSIFEARAKLRITQPRIWTSNPAEWPIKKLQRV